MYPFKGKKKKLNEIVGNIFKNQFSMDNNQLNQIDGLSNSLGSYDQLIDLSTKTKDGQWYVVTTPIFGNLISYEFGVNNAIGLYYVTGNILASQTKNRQTVTKNFNAYLDKEDQLYLDSVGINSELYIKLVGETYWGSTTKYIDFMSEFPKLSKVIRKHFPDFLCEIYTMEFRRYQILLDFIEHDNVLSQIFLTVGEQKYSIKQLLDEKKSKVFVTKYDIYLHIENLSALSETEDLEKMDVSIIAKAGFKMTPIGVYMKYYNHESYCLHFLQTAHLPIATSSMNFENWKNKLYEKYKVNTIDDVPNYQNFNLKASIILFDYHN